MAVAAKYLFIFISILSVMVELDAVTVNPSLCPTNKIAPHRRHVTWDEKPRTFGVIHYLFRPGRPPHMDPLEDLQEQPQEDDPDDCGEIEDYDETDLSSLTPTGQRRKSNKEDRYFINNDYIKTYHQGANRPPSRPHRPPRPTRPPYNFEGNYYGPNGYKPPYYPGDYVKPVKEDTIDHPQAAYQLGLIGGALGHVVGFPPVRPTEGSQLRKPNSAFRFPDNYAHTNRYPKKSQEQSNRSTSIFGSFFDLLFK
ncbi:hypothetical protein HW555_005730 [Spodoptera exigua]|uniref:Uncharacterized protein n=1 Tax=Spodoptera exigua TaxID=7107 RepID=A0A835GFZ0_SPOEX|nr:hypothetical protein HW555_005730 [Spodoptera exigua]